MVKRNEWIWKWVRNRVAGSRVETHRREKRRWQGVEYGKRKMICRNFRKGGRGKARMAVAGKLGRDGEERSRVRKRIRFRVIVDFRRPRVMLKLWGRLVRKAGTRGEVDRGRSRVSPNGRSKNFRGPVANNV